MMRYTKNYLKHFGYTTADWIKCEMCPAQATEIHHVIPKSKFGSKRKGEQDKITNLIALCRSCHDRVHNKDVAFNEEIKEVVKNRK